MRILQIETFGRGGLIHYAYNLSCALAARGHQVTLVTSTAYELEGQGLPGGLDIVKAIAGVPRRAEGVSPGLAAAASRRVRAARDAFAVTRLVRRLRPDVVHLHCTNAIALVYLTLLRRLRVPLVSTAHVVTPHEPRRVEHAAFRRLHRISDLVVAHSTFDRDRLVEECGVEAARVVVIPHGDYGFFARSGPLPGRAAARQRLGLEPEHEVVLFFGYIREYKGLDLLFEAWPDVIASRPRARLLVAGDPVQLGRTRRDELEAWATRLGAVHRFDYVPFADVTGYFRATDVLAMPYRRVSQSGILFLALALGVPLVATRVGALPETLRDGESALLIPPESPAALSAAVVRLLGDRHLRDRLAAGGRRVVDEHSWSSIAARTEAIFARLVTA